MPNACDADVAPVNEGIYGDGVVGIADLLAVIGNWNDSCDGGVAGGEPENLPEDAGDCMDLAAEAGPIGSTAYERAFEGCIELLCARSSSVIEPPEFEFQHELT